MRRVGEQDEQAPKETKAAETEKQKEQAPKEKKGA